MDFREFVKAKLKLSDGEAALFAAYRDFLLQKNAEFNLTALTSDEDIAVRHFEDSLSAVPLIKKNARLADIGSGAGFPAAALKIVRPDISVTMLESVGKKTAFLKELISRLALTETFAVKIRAEEAGRLPAYRAVFDVVTARAVAELSALAEYAAPLLKEGGVMIAYKGGNAAEEITSAKSAFKKLGLTLREARVFTLGGEYGRTLVVAEKIAPTSAEYPRPNKKIQSEPL